MKVQRLVFVSLALCGVATAWWGCAAGNDPSTTQGGTGETGGGGAGGADTTNGAGGFDFDGGTTIGEAGACTSTSATAHRVPLDIIFLVDRSGSMSGSKWQGTTSALTKFFNDPQSAQIGAGLAFFPNFKPDTCDPEGYKILDVPIGALPYNAFSLTNSMPADALGYGTPTHAALKGVLAAATAYQDSHPTHKVIVVLATDGDPYWCEPTSITGVASLAKSALNYNGVRTYVIGVFGSIITNLNKIAEAGGTGAAYDVTVDISLFSEKMKEIRSEALGCEFEIPPVPNGKELDPDEVNFSYTPAGKGDAKVLLRADDLADCQGKPGWYYDSAFTPTKIILCPASCVTVQADPDAKVEALFGCKSQVN